MRSRQPAEVAAPSDAAEAALLLVLGASRSGTSLFSGLSQRLGFYVPQPEVEPTAANPRGFAEPKWVVDFHQQLLDQLGVQLADGRPGAWRKTESVGTRARVRRELRTWLEGQLEHSPRLVVKDPRTTWFLKLWQATAQELGLKPAVALMLRHPAQVVRSKQQQVGGKQLDMTTKSVGWLNVMLSVEQKTRDVPRAVVRHDSLLADWRGTLATADRRLQVGLLSRATQEQVREASELVEPSLHRSRDLWDGLGVPARVAELAEESWRALGELSHDGDRDDAEVRRRLDDLRNDFVQLYDESLAIARSSVFAARTQKRAKAAGPAAR
ncbi:MAG: sulfotransferase family protein [Propionibacteriales bacterium]|nr:sulfotransferase family protein [Propionibacteriales bacterium]